MGTSNLTTVQKTDFSLKKFDLLIERFQAVVSQRYAVHITQLKFFGSESTFFDLIIFELEDDLQLQDGLIEDEIFAGFCVLKERYELTSDNQALAESELFTHALNFITQRKFELLGEYY